MTLYWEDFKGQNLEKSCPVCKITSEIDSLLGGNLSNLSAGIVFPRSGNEVFSKPHVLEPALKAESGSTVSVLAASQLTEVSIIPAFGGLVWYNAGSD